MSCTDGTGNRYRRRYTCLGPLPTQLYLNYTSASFSRCDAENAATPC